MRRVLLVGLGIALGAAIAAALRARRERATVPAGANGRGVADGDLAEHVAIVRDQLASGDDG